MMFSGQQLRSVPVRQFQRQFYTELKEVPFIVTRQEWELNPNSTKGEKMRVEKEAFIVLPYNQANLSLALQVLKQQVESEPQQEQNTPPPVPTQEKKSIIDKLFNK